MFRSLKTNDGKETGVGIAWRVAVDDEVRTFIHHGVLLAVALVYREERVAVAIVTNLGFAGFNEKDAGAIAMRFLDISNQ